MEGTRPRRPTGEGDLASSPSAPVFAGSKPEIHPVALGGAEEGEPDAVELTSWAGRRWETQRIYASGETRTRYRSGRKGARVVVGPPTVTSWGKPPRLDVFFDTAPVEDPQDVHVSHGWSERPGSPDAWSWELVPGPWRDRRPSSVG